MSDTLGMTREQTKFLRAFRKHPLGPPPDAWPSPCVFRRWLRRAAFRSALKSLRDALRFQSDLHLAGAAASAAHVLQATLVPAPADPAAAAESRAMFGGLIQLVKLSHARERTAPTNEPPRPPASIRTEVMIEILRGFHPKCDVGTLIQVLEKQLRKGAPAGAPPVQDR